MNITNLPAISNTSSEAFERIRKRTLQLITILSASWVVMPGIFYAFNDTNNFTGAIIGTVLFLIVFALWFVLASFNQVQTASYGLIFTLLSIALLTGDTARLDIILAALAVSTLILNVYMIFMFYSLMLGELLWIARLRILEGQSVEQSLNQISLAVLLGIIFIIIRFFVNSIRRYIVSAEENARLLQISAEIGQVTAGITQMDELLPRAVDFIRDRFGYYHVQIFLLNETQDSAILRASTGEVGQKLLATGHRLDVGSQSVIGRVTQTGQPVMVRTGDSRVHHRNEFLPNTRAELALPIKDGDRIIGALDVQSTQANAFDDNQEQALQIMTNLLAVSIRNARFFDEQQRNVAENQRLYIEAEASLREIQRLNSELTEKGWVEFTQEGSGRQGVSLRGDVIEPSDNWSPTLSAAVEQQKPVTDANEKNYTVAVPIFLRGNVIGAIEVEPGEDSDQDDTVEILKSVSQRLAVSIDNARLFEETKESTVFEQQINLIVGQYQNAGSVDDLLQITLKELGNTLGATRGAIRLKNDIEVNIESETPSQNGHNGTGQNA